ncbi:hypothetical protein BLNAU_17835 [Blattamonas nauphoetae]|uniref:Uncharacterized protein n=1 Tax=Blattamonas nauphoetae TaxID=2049346 RepID=A0ABQ9XA95_9EUKA|nr:hypothetical protein BLNAU_17835 [Blattamonas nauphoetae]
MSGYTLESETQRFTLIPLLLASCNSIAKYPPSSFVVQRYSEIVSQLCVIWKGYQTEKIVEKEHDKENKAILSMFTEHGHIPAIVQPDTHSHFSRHCPLPSHCHRNVVASLHAIWKSFSQRSREPTPTAWNSGIDSLAQAAMATTNLTASDSQATKMGELLLYRVWECLLSIMPTDSSRLCSNLCHVWRNDPARHSDASCTPTGRFDCPEGEGSSGETKSKRESFQQASH